MKLGIGSYTYTWAVVRRMGWSWDAEDAPSCCSIHTQDGTFFSDCANAWLFPYPLYPGYTGEFFCLAAEAPAYSLLDCPEVTREFGL